MLEQFKQYIKENALIEKGDKIIVALSGGIDSIVLTQLLKEYGAEIVAAHCNFHLRGDESDGDEHFVHEFCKANGIECHTQHFDTEAYAKSEGLSIEMAARELRYTWFEQLRQELGYDKIAVAHHADDQIETFLINLLRGSGIHGLKAMLPQNGNIIRPLLWASREDIRKHALEHNIKWRDDSTNNETIYTRNKLRNIVIPEICSNFANARQTIANSINHLATECALYDQLVGQHIESVQTKADDTVSIAKDEFKNANGKQLLFEWIRQYNFNTSQCEFIAKALSSKPGQTYYSPTHRLCIARDRLVINPTNGKNNTNVCINEGQNKITQPINISFSLIERTADLSISRDNNCAMLDNDKLQYPLRVRNWQHGDRFKPLGMSGSKLVSDFFTDQHLTQVEKDKSLILEDASGKIVWLIGYRIDDRFKINDQTKHILVANITDI